MLESAERNGANASNLVVLDKTELLKAIRHDCVTFFAFYIGEELTLEVPEFHQEIWNELLEILDQVNQPEFLVGHLQKLFAVPREHSKSTLAKLAVVLFMRYSVFRFTLYVSRTGPLAKRALRDVVAYLQSPQECELYGAPIEFKANEQEGLWQYSIGLPGGGRKKVTLLAMGSNQQVRGSLIDNMRPEFVILDDIEDYETADGGPQQEKLDEWALGSLLKATARRSFRLFLGNMVRSTTLLARLSKDPDWNPTVFGALVRDKESKTLQPLWPGRWTVKGLLKEYRGYRRLGKGHIWETEMMNLSGDKLLQMNLDSAVMVPFVSPEDVECGFICLDPAFGKKSWHDESGISVHVRIRGTQIPVVAATRLGRYTESELFEIMLEFSYEWNLATWAIEAQAAQRLLIPYFRLMLSDREMSPDLITMLPVMTGQQAKGTRINLFRNSVAQKSYAFAESELDAKLRLEEYSPAVKDHDDLCDSMAYGPVVWDLYGTVVESNGTQNIAGALMQTAGINSNSLGEANVCTF